jgi:ribonucleoside-diphosphate reductase alpha chain|nr:MAG TPA: ribonucleotide-diphosphate reductase subunit alpha [Caudoviricetes sp.]
MAQFTDNAMTVLNARYLRKNEEGTVVETPDDMLHRVSEALSDGDAEKSKRFYELMDRLDFLPNTPTLVNAGRENGQLSACFVLPIEDSMDGIFTAVKNAAMIHKTGGGTGFSFSRLRSKGERVSTTGGEASGVVSFLRVFNEATNSVKQGGVRRGANMGLLRIDHPDVVEFIMCKDDTTQLTNFNLSVGITEAFMKAVVNDDEWSLIDPHTKKATAVGSAKQLWKKIVHQAWKNGEPGIVFLDKINDANPTPELGEIEATNPCGEQPLLPYESCNLGSINLSNHVNGDGIDFEHLKDTVETGVDFLNAVLDHNSFPLPEIKEQTLKTRKIGLGVMGFADMLIKLNVRYDSEAAEFYAKKVMSFIQDTAHAYNEQKGYKNATLTTIAPTGTISMLANVSSGIEPNFSWVYTRNSCDQMLYVVHPLMESVLMSRDQYNDDILHKLAKGIPVKDIPELCDIGDHWITSQEIKQDEHIKIQAAFQAFTDNAVSKTINLPNKATENDVEQAYMLAYETGCKGITVYRDGSRESQVLNFEKDEPASKPTVRTRPERVDGYTDAKKIGCGKLYITVNHDEYGPIEVFTNTGKAGGCPAQSEGLARMVSLALRYDVPVDAIAKQLCGIRCMSTIRKDGCAVLSCPDAIGKALREFDSTSVKNTGSSCPECGQPLEQSEGCVICHSCGYSKCG